MLYGSGEIRDVHRRIFRLGPVLNPCPQLIEKARRVPASSSSAVALSGHLKVAVEIMDVRDDGRDFIEVFDRGFWWNCHIIL